MNLGNKDECGSIQPSCVTGCVDWDIPVETSAEIAEKPELMMPAADPWYDDVVLMLLGVSVVSVGL